MPALAKLTRPKLHQVVPRERLFERLDRCRERPLVWVAGPPGAGKTALVASYVDARRLGGLWYQVDDGDRELDTFFHYLSEAAATRRKLPPLPRLRAEHAADLPGFTRVYFRQLFARLKAPSLLVFDNYHELAFDSPLHALLDTVAREVPQGIAVLVISRTDPPPPCAALRAQERLALLDWDELRLTFEETRQVAAGRHALDEAALRRAHEQAGGWLVGLTLSLEQRRSLGRDSDPGQGAHDVLFNYFAGQIFGALPASTREVLMQCALLPRITAAEGAKLSGDPHAGALLDGLYKRRLFVDRRGEAYQFHDLFRAFLLQEFNQAYAPEAARTRRSQAARILQQSGQTEAAFGLACAIPDWELAGALLLQCAALLFEQGRGRTLHHYVQALPAERVEAQPWLCLWRAVALSAQTPALARDEFVRLFERLRDSEDHAVRLLCCSGVVVTHYLEFDDFAPLDRWIDELQPLLAARIPLPAPTPELRVNTALLFALSFRRPDPVLLADAIVRVHALMRADVSVNARLDAAAQLLSHHCNCADYDQAAQLVGLVTPWLDDPELGPIFRALWTMQLGRYEINRGELERGLAQFEEALRITRDNALSVPVLSAFCCVGLAYGSLVLGDLAGADAAHERMLALAGPTRRIVRTLDTGLRGLIASLRGDVVDALALAHRQLDLAEGAGVPWHLFRSRLQLAFALADAGQDPKPVLDLAREQVRATAYAASEYNADFAEAYAALRRGDTAAIAAPLTRGLERSRGDSGLFFLRLEGRVLPPLLAHALEHGIDADYAARLVRRLHLAPPREDAPNWPWPIEVRLLGKLDLRIGGAAATFSRKLPKKTLALLKALVALGAGSVSEQRLIDTFWGDEEGDVAARSLDATVLRLRNLLGDAAAIVQQGGKIRLDRERVWVDVFAFERALADAQDADARRLPEAIAHYQRALDLYRGNFLGDDEGESWPVAARERLRGRFIHALVACGQKLEQTGAFEAAIAAYQRGLDADAVIEPFYQGLMRCYQQLQRHSEAIGAYRRLKQVLSVTLGLAPSAVTEKLYQSLR